VRIDVVEIDDAIVSVAADWFSFVADDQLSVTVTDGLEYIQQLASTGDYFCLYIIHYMTVVSVVMCSKLLYIEPG